MEVTESHEAVVGEITVRRALPRRGRRTVGAWCFADHMGPVEVTAQHGLDVGPHPHMGLQTVTWLTKGTALHRDSLGSEQLISPGQLNLMTAGHGISHSEEATSAYEGSIEGIQLWIALPEATRHGPSSFTHLAVLSQCELAGGTATVLIGELDGLWSPARYDTPLVGVDLALEATSLLGLRPDFEHALIVLEGMLHVEGHELTPGHLGYLGTGRDELELVVAGRTRALLLGGEPLEEELLMWWNLVGRTRQEIDDAFMAWQADDGRFGTVASPLARVETRPPYWHVR